MHIHRLLTIHKRKGKQRLTESAFPSDDVGFWASLSPVQQRMVAYVVQGLAKARASGDTQHEAKMCRMLTWLSRDLCGDPDALPDAFDCAWARQLEQQQQQHGA